MSEMITTTGRSINTVTAEIVAISNQAAQMAYMSMVEIGKRLVEAKGMVEHGEWGDWLKNEVKFSQRTAQNFMQIYQRSTEGNTQTFANLGYSQIVALLALPEGEAEEFAQTHDVQDMSVRELKETIAEEKRQREQAEGRAEALQQAASRAKTSEEALTKKLERLEKRLSRAEQAEANARKEADRLRENPEITDAQKEQLTAEARAQAAAEVRAELQKELDAARAEVKRITEERAAAEKAAQNDRKAEKMADPDVTRFNDLGKQIMEDFNRLDGYRLRIVAKDPDMEPKLRAYMAKMLSIITKKYGGLADGAE